MSPHAGDLLSKSLYNGADRVRVRNSPLRPMKHVGSLKVSTTNKSFVLKNVLHVSSLKHNILSVKQLCQENSCSVLFDDSSICVKDKILSNVWLHASSTSNFYRLAESASTTSALVALLDSVASWHRRLGHCEA